MELNFICEGVYQSFSEHRPSVVTHEGRSLHRFMDVFYIECEADELDASQVEALCRARALNLSSFGGANSKVREIFQGFIRRLQPVNILEVGAGTNPLMTEADLTGAVHNYVRSDADPVNVERGNVFSGAENVLHHPNEYFHFAVAVFVLHFKFYSAQISELYRCLRQDGIFLGNVYRRTEKSRMILEGDFRDRGFELVIVNDPSNLCQDHQYWVLGKSGAHVESAAELLADVISSGLQTD